MLSNEGVLLYGRREGRRAKKDSKYFMRRLLLVLLDHTCLSEGQDLHHSNS